jgi:Fic family protein
MFKPKFSITSDMLTAISEIAVIKDRVERSRVLPLNEAQLRRQAIARMAHTSTSIEGNPLAQHQVDRVLSGMSINADERSIREVKNYQTALHQVEKMAGKDEPLDIEAILKLHAILMDGLLPKEKTGEFRPGPIYIVDDMGDGREQLRYEGPLPEKVRPLLKELLDWLKEARKEKLHPVIKAAIFHLEFVTIHPFSDGNGRITRLLTTYLLYKDKWDFRKIIVLEDFYNQERMEYYNALNTIQGNEYHKGEDSTTWIEYFIIGFLVEARKVMQTINSIGFGTSSKDSEPVFLDRDEIKVMEAVSQVGKITSDETRELLKVAKRTAQLKLKNLVEKKLIKSVGKGPATYYTLSEK